MARDGGSLIRWGNGDVEIGGITPDQVPYALGLIRQSLERQLEDGA